MSILIRSAAILALAVPAFAQTPARKTSTPSAAHAAAASASTPLPPDPAVRTGTLANGLRYYIRKNSRPEKRAELRLVVNAGSVLEDTTQLGLAHFIEHMAFNGTTHFRKNDLVQYLQSIGVRFGADLNAETGFDQTIYILPIPTDTARIVDKAFDILEDWAHGQLFDSTEVVNERGVVMEEWRMGRGAQDRMLHQLLPVLLAGSRYAGRLPIGTPESIQSATPSRLRAFYNTWYRPDLMAVIAVGDFDPDSIQAEIQKHFAHIRTPAHEKPRPRPVVPGNAKPLIGVASDKEATGSVVELLFKRPAQVERTTEDFRRDLMEALYFNMLNARFEEIAQKPSAPFLGAGASVGSFFARNEDAFSLGASVADTAVDAGLQALLTEAKRVDQFGFLQSELDRAKADVLRGYEQSYAERDKTLSANFVEEYITNFLQGDAIPSVAEQYDLAKEIVPRITLADVNAMASEWVTDSNRVLVAEMPQKAGVTPPSTANLLGVLNRAASIPVTAYTETLSGDALLPKAPTPGRIVSEHTDSVSGVTEWKLSNGARVLVKPTDFKADEVLFSAYSLGGTSLAPDSAAMSAEFASTIVQQSGLGEFSAVDLVKKLSGKAVSLAPAIGETTEGLSGNASPKDLETLMQLAYLEFTAPRLDTTVFHALSNQIKPFLANRGSSPDQVFADTVEVTMSQHNVRDRPLSTATWAEVSPQTAMNFFKDRFANAGDFTFVFVGNVKLDSLKPLAEKYLASLPNTGRVETWRDLGDGPPTGVVQRTVHMGSEPKANTVMVFTGPCTYDPAHRTALNAMLELFQIQLDRTLREQLGGTYSPSVGGSCSRAPRQEYGVEVTYSSSPANVEKLSSTVLALIDTLQTRGPSPEDVAKVEEQMLRAYEVNMKQNSYWMQVITGRDQAGEPFSGALGPFRDLMQNVTPAEIQEAAKLYFNTKNYARFYLLPATAP